LSNYEALIDIVSRTIAYGPYLGGAKISFETAAFEPFDNSKARFIDFHNAPKASSERKNKMNAMALWIRFTSILNTFEILFVETEIVIEIFEL
jgi:hypothetical protein